MGVLVFFIGFRFGDRSFIGSFGWGYAFFDVFCEKFEEEEFIIRGLCMLEFLIYDIIFLL